MRLLLIVLLLQAMPALADLSEARALIDDERFSEARTILELRLSERPDDSEALTLLGRTHVALGDLDEGRRSLERAVDLSPDIAEAHHWLGRCAVAQAELTGMLGKLGFVREARRELEEALRLDPKLLETRLDLVRFHATMPGVAGADIDLARRYAGQVAKVDAAKGAFAFGYIAYREGELEDAERNFRRSIELEPNWRESSLWASYLFMQTEKYDEAFSVLERLASRDPSFGPVWFELGRTAAYSSTRLDEAEAWLMSYLETPVLLGWPSHARAWSILGLARERANKSDLAKEAFERALRLDPDVEEAAEGLQRLSDR